METRRDPVHPGGALWRRPLPAAPESSGRTSASIRYGDYFEAIRTFLIDDDGAALRQALAHRCRAVAATPSIRGIDVFLVKHGAFYHPARLEVDIGRERPRCFVLNVAVSETGNARHEEECRSLIRLSSHPAARFIPRVYGQGAVKTAAGRPVGMWLGEWFDGYHEFHWTREEAAGRPAVAVWDPEAGKRLLNSQQAGELYRRAAAVLTDFYDLRSFEQVQGWHHAAGDFVVRPAAGRLEVRLITVRGYRSLFAASPQGADELTDAGPLLQALLLFVIRLSLRMRLDRLDGVGELFLADDAIVTETVRGVRQALAEKPAPSEFPDAPLRCFDAFASACTETDLHALVSALVDLYPPDHPERTILEASARAHAAALFHAFVNG